MKNIFKKLIKGIVILGVIIYGTVFLGHRVFFKLPYSDKPTIKAINKEGYRLNAASHKQPKTMETYIKVLSSQVKNYNKHIEKYWTNNPEKNQYVIAKSLEEKEAYMISPEGKVNKLSKKEFDYYDINAIESDSQWQNFNKNGISGAYITVSPEGLKNYYVFQKYYHLGTYDQFLSYSHELFHSITQSKWVDAKGTKLTNKERKERLEDLEARRYRMLIQQQLAEAISDEENRETHIKEALATYKTYREKNKEDYKSTLLYDRLEGTAFYYEMTSALYAGYPEQIKNEKQMYEAVKIILENDPPAYRLTGAVAEGYRIGGYSGIILDLIAIDNKKDPMEWKKQIEKNGELTPLLILEEQYKDQKLPELKKIPSEKDYNKWIEETNKVDPKKSGIQNTFDILYSILY